MATDGIKVEITKIYNGRTGPDWSDEYELARGVAEGELIVNLNDTVVRAVVQPIVDQLVAAERLLHSNKVHFIRATVSTWRADSKPYKRDALAVFPLEGVGTGFQETATNGVDQDTVLNISRVPLTGKLGVLKYRGCLQKDELIKLGEDFTLATDAPVLQRITAWKAAINGLIGEQLDNKHQLCMIGGTLVKSVVPVVGGPVGLTKEKRTYIAPFSTSAIIDFVFKSVSENPRNHKYFDVTNVTQR